MNYYFYFCGEININKNMTRINAFINPSNLIDSHLIAEIKEINQLCGSLKKIKFNDIPNNFTLNKGHVKFFINKGLFIKNRFYLLKQEALNRGFNIQCEFINHVWNSNTFNDLIVDINEQNRIKNILIERISLRINTQKYQPKYYSKTIERNIAINLINK